MRKLTFIVLVFLIGSSLFIWSGVYNIAATEKHWAITNELIEVLRERSIESRLENIVVPNLDDPERIASAAEGYDEMCAGCHLAPGIKTTEIHEGLYPKPPILHESDHATNDSRRNYWIIKNGIKLTGMPAWGASHKDEGIWGLVAFVRKLKNMSAEEYIKMTAGSKMKNSHH